MLVIGAYADDVYDHLSASFDDPSATIVYPYVYRTLNNAQAQHQARPTSATNESHSVPLEPPNFRQLPVKPMSSETPSASPRNSGSAFGTVRSDSSSRPETGSVENHRLHSPPDSPHRMQPDPDARLVEILGHISSETTGALHKEGITELYYFLKAHPEKEPKVDKVLNSTGPQFRKYLARALASRAAEDEERKISVAQTLSRTFYITFINQCWKLRP